VAELTIKGAVPVDAKVTMKLPMASTFTFPKTTVLVLTERVGFNATPLPTMLMSAIPLLDELLLMESCPIALPATTGLN
jgi:hypothetical protein